MPHILTDADKDESGHVAEPQLLLFQVEARSADVSAASYRDRLTSLLSGDLDFHEKDSAYASHNMHAFPAKFPPQLPRTFIEGLTQVGDVVLDPMMGSGTAVLEALLTDRQGIGFDIDPLAILLSRVKTLSLDRAEVIRCGNRVLHGAQRAIAERGGELAAALEMRWDRATRRFVDYWFAWETQIELLALVRQIALVPDARIRNFLKLVLSGTIITKMGGVSLALDLAHTRPHRAKVVLNRAGEIVHEQDLSKVSPKRVKFLTKTLRSPLDEFGKRLRHNVRGLLQVGDGCRIPYIAYGNAQNLALPDASVDLIVTSPPYASNAIDYMRAHKFSLVWLGYPVDDLSDKRKEYIGGEAVSEFDFVDLPSGTKRVVRQIAALDEKKGQVLHRYYSEMARVLRVMYRVLRPATAAIVVVGSSTMRGRDTETEICLAEIGERIGFEVPKIGVRSLDRNRRMMPAGAHVDSDSQIQQRMHEEYVIGFYKPESAEEVP